MRRFLRFSAIIAAMLTVVLGVVAVRGSLGVHAQAVPTVTIQAPTAGATVTNPVQMKIASTGAQIAPVGDTDPNTNHYHYFIDRDPATVVKQGERIPGGQPDIIHTDNVGQVLPNLAAGPHTVWIVLSHSDHTPYNPSVETKVSFTVTGGPAPAPSALPANGDDFSGLKLIILGVASVLVAGGFVSLRLAQSRR